MPLKIKPHSDFQGVFWAYLEDGSRRLATLNLTPGRAVYGERLVKFKGQEYRVWDAYRSKLAAAILKGLKTWPLASGVKVLYLGAATGTTASHVSDIVGEKGKVFCVEFSERVIRELISNVCNYRSNMIPIMADARKPENYRWMVEKVEVVYCDIAQPEQAKVLADNADLFLQPGGHGLIALKARSIDVTKEPEEVFQREVEVLKERGFQIIEEIVLEPYDKAHAMVVVKRS
ncbi:MAG: fibrillarin-like rRNA/tRNA 2'-O-methyltransferase [Candidatus Hecatellaceae archaeon]